MCADAVTEQDSAPAIIPPIQAAGAQDVKEVRPLPGHRIAVAFYDGTSGLVDLSARIASPQAGVFGQLRDAAIFNAVHVMYGAVTWPGEIDLAPDAMYAETAATGAWTLN